MARACLGRGLLRAAAGLLLLAALVHGAIPECPADQPFGECDAGNPCEKRDACDSNSWCLRGCGCSYKCLNNKVVTIATHMPTDDAPSDDPVPLMGSTTAGGANSSAAADGGADESPDSAAAQSDVAAAIQAAIDSAQTAKPRVAKPAPVALPAASQMPNLTALALAAKLSLNTAMHEAVVKAYAPRPDLCPDGRAQAKCVENGCSKQPCGEGQVCVPECGTCVGHRCVDVTLPAKPSLPKLPPLPAFASLPKLSIPKPVCGNNQAMDVTATLRTLPAVVMMEPNSPQKTLTILCSTCPNGTVAKPPALACTLCTPGTFADRGLAICRKCAKGYYSSKTGATECKPCPADAFAPLQGLPGCIPCPPGFTTNGKRAQSSCAFDETYSKFSKFFG